MASSQAPRGFENLVTCPYNKSHQILPHRFQTHLVKCKKNYPDVQLKICPFNTAHHIPEPELDSHVVSCPDRSTFDRYKYSVEDVSGSDNNSRDELTFLEQPPPLPSEENWDDVSEPTYDPQKYAMKAPVLRNLVGGTPSERKAFRAAERIRLNNLQYHDH